DRLVPAVPFEEGSSTPNVANGAGRDGWQLVACTEHLEFQRRAACVEDQEQRIAHRGRSVSGFITLRLLTRRAVRECLRLVLLLALPRPITHLGKILTMPVYVLLVLYELVAHRL